MAISRDVIANYLDTQFSALAAAVGQDSNLLIGYAPDLDDALRLLNVAEVDLPTATVDDGLRQVVFALARYYTAQRLWILLGDRVNTETGLTSYNFDGQRKQAQAIMDNAAGLCARLGYPVDGRVAKTPVFRVY